MACIGSSIYQINVEALYSPTMNDRFWPRLCENLAVAIIYSWQIVGGFDETFRRR